MALTAKKVYAILKRQISDMEAKLNSPVRYRGTVATADLLPLNPDIGDMYNIESKSVYGEAGMNVAWNGVVWDTMGAPIDMSLYFTKEEAEAVIQRLVTEYFEKNPVKPGATTEQAQQIEQNKTDIASLKTETGSLKEDLSNKITKFYASSKGETHFADSDNGKIMDMMLYGKSEQKQYSGKNLLNATLQTTIKNGVTCTANGDGTYTLNGTATERAEFVIDVFNIDISKKYKLIAFTKERSYIECFVQLNQSPWTIYGTSTDSQVTITGSKNIRLVIAVIKGTTLSNEIIKPMIVDASLYPDATYDDFEPYTGSIPSPNPDYPQEIKSVANPTVKVCGKNLLNYKETTITNGLDAAGIKFVENGFRIYTKKDMSYCSSMTYLDFSKLRIGETYTLSANLLIVKGVSRLTIRNRANKIISGSSNITESGAYKISFTLTDEMRYASFFATFDANISGDVIVTNIQLEKNPTPTVYEPYHEQTVTLPYTLNAIPVSSGGNVTIDGQQYMSDYVDVERGKLVRMCKHQKLFDMNINDWGSGDNGARHDWYVDVEKYDNTIFVNRIIPCLVSSLKRRKSGVSYPYFAYETVKNNGWVGYSRLAIYVSKEYDTLDKLKEYVGVDTEVVYQLKTPEEIDLTPEEIAAFKALATYYPVTNISVNSEQLDGYTVFNYPISMKNGWDYVKKQLNDNRDYIYNMDTKTQDIDTQAAEAYVNSEYAVALTELEV